MVGKEDYVSLEMAKLLKEKGFDVPCCSQYTDKDNVKYESYEEALSAGILEVLELI